MHRKKSGGPKAAWILADYLVALTWQVTLLVGAWQSPPDL
jgi:hypothetical protein